MAVGSTIDRAYPKVKPLTDALLSAAAELGATEEEFRMACERINAMVEKRKSRILLAELQEEREMEEMRERG